MPLKKKIIIIPDAQVIIDLYRIALWGHVTHSFDIGVTPIIIMESRFYRDASGAKQPICLMQEIESKTIQKIETSIEQITLLHDLLRSGMQHPLDAGELEAIAFLKSQKLDDYIFCSGDALAIKYIGALGLRHRAISLQKLLEKRSIKAKLEHKYSDSVFQMRLNEGFRDAKFLLKVSDETSVSYPIVAKKAVPLRENAGILPE